MKKYFYLGILGLIAFEVANVYFIMPMPGSQRMNSIGLAYFLYSWRFLFRLIFVIMIFIGLVPAFKRSKFWPVLFLLLAGLVVYAANFMMAADSMFLETKHLKMSNAGENKVDAGKLVLGIDYNGEAKAYPIQYIGYHHKVFDSIGGKPIMVTYCTVCRTGRIFEPVVNGKHETFRLVGMDHFNAMFEDESTKSWWRQENGEAITGKLKGERLPELPSTQMTLSNWLLLHPNSLVMQPGDDFKKQYDAMTNYESGKSKSGLTRMDSLSWQDKSWVAGIELGKESKAYDWNTLLKEHVIHDELGNQPITLVLLNDNKSFAAFLRKNKEQHFQLNGDTLKDGEHSYSLTGKSYEADVPSLQKINAYQEYWHSWRTFHPATKKY